MKSKIRNKILTSFLTFAVTISSFTSLYLQSNVQQSEALTKSSLPNNSEVAIAGGYSGFSILPDDTVYSYGRNDYGQLGNNSANSMELTPVEVPQLKNAKTIYPGTWSNFAVMKDGTITSWGNNTEGQLGLGDNTNRKIPTTVAGLTNVKDIVLGANSSYILHTDGTVSAMGKNHKGQLGLGDTTDRNTPTKIPGLSNVTDLECGGYTCMAKLSDGTIMGWGYNADGELALGHTNDQWSPIVISSLTNVKVIQLGGYHGAVILNDDSVKVWGRNINGQLGLGDNTNKTSPATLASVKEVKDIQLGWGHSVILFNNGTVKTFGINNNGQLGLGDTTDRNVPTIIPSLSSISRISVGLEQTYAISGYGEVIGWGQGLNGQLATGTVNNETSPISLANINNLYNKNGLNEGVPTNDRYLNFDIKDTSGNIVTSLGTTDTTKSLRLVGSFEAGGLLGKSAKIKYSVRSKNIYEDIQVGDVVVPFTVNDTNKDGTFNKTITIKRGATSCVADEICLPETSSTYNVMVWIEYDEMDGSTPYTQTYSRLNKTLEIVSSASDPHKTNDDSTAADSTMGVFHVNLYDNNTMLPIATNQKFSTADLLASPMNFKVDGYYIRDADIGKEVVISYDIIDYDSRLNKTKNEGLIARYTQTSDTDGKTLPFNRNFSIKIASSGETELNTNYNLIPNEERDYIIRVRASVDGKITKIQDFPIHVFVDKNKTVDANVNTNLNNDVSGLTGQIIGNNGLLYTIKNNSNDITEISLNDLKQSSPYQMDLQGVFGTTIPTGTEVKIKYNIETMDDGKYIENNEGILKTYEHTMYTSAEEVEFNRMIRFTTKDPATLRASGEYKPMVQLHDYPSNYTFSVQVWFRQAGTTDEYRFFQESVKEIKVTGTDASHVSTDDSNVNTDVHILFNLDEIKADGTRQEFKEADLTTIQNTPARIDLNGTFVPNANTGDTVKIEYDVRSLEGYVVDNLVKTYKQTDDISTNYVEFNREFYLSTKQHKATSGGLDKPNTVYVDDITRSYVVRVTATYNNETSPRWLMDKQILVKASASENLPDLADVDENLHEELPTIPNGDRLAYTLKKDGNSFTSIDLSTLNSQTVKLDLLGNYKGDSPMNQSVNIKFDITSIDSPYIMNYESLLKHYEQNIYTYQQSVEFNRSIYITSEGNPSPLTTSPVIKLKNYPGKYTFKVQVSFGDGADRKVYNEKVIEFDVTGSSEGYFNVPGDVPEFPYPTNLEVQLQQVTSSGLKELWNSETQDGQPTVVSGINASDIKENPMRLRMEGLFTNKIDSQYDDILIRYDVTALESYSENAIVNDTIKRYSETVYTEGRPVEFNRDIWISTKSRTNKSGDNAESTIYLEDDTQYYTLRITAFNKTTNKVVVLRDIKFLVNGDRKPYDDMEGPSITLPTSLSAYFQKPDGSLTENLEITARDLNNAANGIDVDLRGFFKSTWNENDPVTITYDLTALNTYKDYIKDPNGVEETLEKDYEDKINGTDPTEYKDTTLVSPMMEWLGKESQNGFLKKYTVTQYTKNNHEGYMKKFNLRTKLDKDVEGVKDNESAIILDNVARSYKLKVRAQNGNVAGAAGIVEKVIDLKITTVKPTENEKPAFPGPISVISPQRGTGWFIDESMNISWNQASDSNDELLYYKIYYYYTTTNDKGEVNDEIRQYIKRFDDMPVGSNILSTPYIVDTPAKIEPAYIRIIACDINHVCSDPTRSNPFKFNQFGENGGGGGGSAAIPANITIYPKPDGLWKNDDIPLSVMFDGDPSLLIGAIKRYQITNSSAFPGVLTQNLPADGTITLTNNGVHYVHVQFELSDGSVISASAGPYKIDKSNVDGFTIRLKDSDGNTVTDWTNENPILEITQPSTTSQSGTFREYMIEGYHSNWQPYKDGIEISVSGNYRIFGRVGNKAGTYSEQKYVEAKIDKNKPDFDAVNITQKGNGTYEVQVKTYEAESGIDKVILSNGTTLNMNGNSASYIKTNMTTKPLAVQALDKAGNVSDTKMFLEFPTITYKDGYNSTDVYRKDVAATIEANGILTYKLGSRLYGCEGSPCDITITKNTTFAAINTSGIFVSTLENSIENIDKSPIRVVLNAERDRTDENKITFTWNYDLANAKLTCEYPGGTETFEVAGTGVVYNGTNVTYKCKIEGTIYGEEVVSNTITVYPDFQKPVDETGGVDLEKKDINANLFIEESRLGTTYYINTRKNNSSDGKAPLPDGLFQ